MKIAEEFLSVNEAAAMLGVTTGRVRQLLIAKELRGRKINQQAWILARKDVACFAKETGRILYAKIAR